MKICLHVVACLLLLCSIASSAPVQAQEVQVPVDESGRIDQIDVDLERKLQLFSDYPHFFEARLFQVSDSTFVLEVLQRPGDGLIKNRLEMTSAEVAEFRAKVTDRVFVEAPAAVLDQTGRTKLLIWSTILSLGYYGWAVPIAADVDDAKTFVGLYMVTSGAGFFYPFNLTKESKVTDGMGTLAVHGMTRGILHGILIGRIIEGDDLEGRTGIIEGMIGSIAEGSALARLANRGEYNPGTAELLGIGDDFGMAWGLGAAALADDLDEEGSRTTAAAVLVGAAAGFYTGKYLAGRQHYTRGDAYVVRAGGLLGAFVPVAILDLLDVEEERAYVAASMAGSGLGIGLAHRMTRDRDFTTGQGALITIGELAGALGGMGLAFLLTDDVDDGTAYLVSSAIGASLGFWGIYRSFEDHARIPQAQSSLDVRIGPGLLFDSLPDRTGRSSRIHPRVYFGASVQF